MLKSLVKTKHMCVIVEYRPDNQLLMKNQNSKKFESMTNKLIISIARLRYVLGRPTLMTGLSLWIAVALMRSEMILWMSLNS